MSSTSVLISSESLSTDSLACWPASVSGLPRPLRSSTNVLVALFMSPIALLTESSERLPPFSELAAEVIESFHVVKPEQRLSAQSAVADVPLALAARELHPFLADPRLDAVWKGGDPVGDPGPPERGAEFVCGRVGSREQQVGADARVEEVRVLAGERDEPAHVLLTVLA